MIQANCRAQFTAEDFAFVVRTLARSPGEAVSLVTLLSSLEERDSILDHELIHRSLIDQTGCLQVSSAFYFYVVTRRVLRQIALEERALTDYVASILLAFAQTPSLQAPPLERETRSGSVYLSDLLGHLRDCPEEKVFSIRKHVGEYALFFSGMFAERVTARAQRRGAPGLGFYETIGQDSYRCAARHPQARRLELELIFDLLAAEFHRVRLALNDLAETVFHFHATPAVLFRPL